MKGVKKIYDKAEALVSDELIASSDKDINAAIPSAAPGMIIYNAGQTIVKQLSLDGKWVPMASGGAAGKDGKDGKSAYELAKEQNPSVGTLDEWLASLKGEKGAKGDAGAAGKAGQNGKSVTSIELKTNTEGRVISGTVTFDDMTNAAITVTVAEE